MQVIRDYLRRNHLDDKVVFRGIRCFGKCSEGPFVLINGKTFEKIDVKDVESVLDTELSELIRIS